MLLSASFRLFLADSSLEFADNGKKSDKKPFYDMDKSEMKMCADNGIIRLVQRLRITFIVKKDNFYTNLRKRCKNVKTHILQVPISH